LKNNLLSYPIAMNYIDNKNWKWIFISKNICKVYFIIIKV